jgi:uncharacterized protein
MSPPWLRPFLLLWSLHIVSAAPAMMQKGSVPLSAAEAVQERLRQAIKQGDASAVEEALNGGANLRRPFNFGPLPLTEAAYAGNPKIVQLLLDRGAPINARTPMGETALMAAAKAGSPGMVALLLDKGADVNARDWRGATALAQFNYVSIQNLAEIAGLLIDRGARLNLADIFGNTPLLAATKFGDLDLMKRMLEQGADPNARNKQGWTAMMHIYGGSATERFPPLTATTVYEASATERFRLLLEHGADLHARDKTGMTVLMHAAEHADSDALEFLIERGADVTARDRTGRTALMTADEYQGTGIERKLELLLSKGANVNGRDRDRKTALIHAAKSFDESGRHVSVPRKVRWLREHGADINAQSLDGTTPLLFAARVGNNALVQYLLAEGADPNLRDRNGVSAMAWVAHYDESDRPAALEALRSHGARTGLIEALLLKEHDTAARLLAEGAKVEAVGPHGQTALMVAAEHGYADIAETLIRGNALVNAREEYGRTALHFSVGIQYYGLHPDAAYPPQPDPTEFERLQIVRALLDRGADVNATTPLRHVTFGDLFGTVYPETALQWAVRRNYVSIVKLLLERGASVSGKVGQTALRMAVKSKLEEAAALLREAGAKE